MYCHPVRDEGRNRRITRGIACGGKPRDVNDDDQRRSQESNINEPRERKEDTKSSANKIIKADIYLQSNHRGTT